MKYTVRSGDTIYDVAYNTSGSLGTVDAIMENNDLTDYSQTLFTGMDLTVPDEILNNAASLKASQYPFNSSYVVDTTLDQMFTDFEATMTNN